ncbi:MAG: DUF2828 family protein [Oscillospiraceae bacterium]|nr:DUF2828 family protein [Oscillospiraceae bacterium]
MLNLLKKESNITRTENGALTHRSSGTDCMDLFFRAGGMRGAAESEIADLVCRAYIEDPVKTMKILFYVRDIRGGMGERRFFRIAMQTLAAIAPESVCRNLPLFAEYGRFDDLCALLGTSCEAEAIAVIRTQFQADLAAMAAEKPASLLAKWLPSVNASSAETCAMGRKIAKALGMNEKQYRKSLSALRRYTDIIENRLRTYDYTFSYEKQTSGAMMKYRKAFIRNDRDRYTAYLSAVEKHEAVLHADTLYPYEIIRSCKANWMGTMSKEMHAAERRALDAAWRNLPVYGAGTENALAVVDGSGSMYTNRCSPRPIDAALSLGIYFAEHNRGAFANHFITFSKNPQLVEIKGGDIVEKALFCSTYCEAANTNLEAVFDLILQTAVKNRLPQAELPAKLYIISDMEFDGCIIGGNDRTMFGTMRRRYARYGYVLPQIVFWNVASRNQNIPVTASQTGAALVSGASASIFDMVAGGELTPETIMNRAIETERYAKVC